MRCSAKGWLVAAIAVTGSLLLSGSSPKAEELSADELIKMLAPTERPGDNSLNSAPPPSFGPSDGSSSSPSKPSASANRPSASLEVNFETNSATLTADGMRQLGKLGAALTSPTLADSRFLIVGHTDARGSKRHNLALSKKRAQTVRTFLVSSFDIPGSRLSTQGVGSTQPKEATDPEAGENRRVEIVNVSQ
jgi:outer membrane protein OmpA-like peptidoglycan-associated protein